MDGGSTRVFAMTGLDNLPKTGGLQRFFRGGVMAAQEFERQPPASEHEAIPRAEASGPSRRARYSWAP